MKMLSLIAVALVCAGCATSAPTSRDVSQVSTQGLCAIRLVEGNFYTVIAELERRNEFSEDDLLHIRSRTIVPGMTAGAVRCSYGTPQQVISNSPGDEFDTVYVYGLETENNRRLGETRVYLADDSVVRIEDFPMIVSPIVVN